MQEPEYFLVSRFIVILRIQIVSYEVIVGLFGDDLGVIVKGNGLSRVAEQCD